MTKKLGIFGGTFNPVHNMHLNMATQFLTQMNLDLCLFIPAYVSPFKTEKSELMVSAEHRLNMLKIAVGIDDKFKTDTFEIDKKDISYTIDTINYLQAKYSDFELFMLIGSDQIKDFKEWKSWQEILNIVNLCVVKRPDTNINEISILTDREKIIFIEMPESEISSSRIREMIFNDESISGFVPKQVEDYISKHKLYGN
ncbi:MAG: nicotinate (nicotinamide) nucleotide adenylyltransferase [bacterium]